MSTNEYAKSSQIYVLIEQAPEALRGYIRFLEERFTGHSQIIERQTQQIQSLTERVKDLEARIAKNSSNSSKPPSSDGQRKSKTQSLRGRTGKKPGGQPGRVGKTLEKVDSPDHIIEHAQNSCRGCGSSLENVIGECAEARQVFDIPEPHMVVTEHRVISKHCPCCAIKTKGCFPDGITAHVQYGERARALMVYLNNQHLIPFERISQFFEDIYGKKTSPSTIIKANSRAFRNLELFEAGLKAYLTASQVLHFDETGVRCLKTTYWVHVSASTRATLYHVHKKRGREGMVAGGVIDFFCGTGVHDGLKTYSSFENMVHSLCNSHHLRELKFVYEQEDEAWAKEMETILLQMKKEAEAARGVGKVPEERLLALRKEYASIVLRGLNFHVSAAPLPKGQRGRRKQRIGKNLLDRLSDGMDSVIRFLTDLSVPFTNNLAEQDLRMIKVQQKISGCFRDLTGATMFCRIRSCVSTARKQGWSILNTLMSAIKGHPLPAMTG